MLPSAWLFWWRWCGEPCVAGHWNGALYLGGSWFALGELHNNFASQQVRLPLADLFVDFILFAYGYLRGVGPLHRLGV